MKMKKLLLVSFPIIAFVLELLPYGVVLNFANPEGEPWRRTYSYFSLTPFGYANFGPFITAILTCALLALAVIYLFKPRKGLKTAILQMVNLKKKAKCISLSRILEPKTKTGVG